MGNKARRKQKEQRSKARRKQKQQRSRERRRKQQRSKARRRKQQRSKARRRKQQRSRGRKQQKKERVLGQCSPSYEETSYSRCSLAQMAKPLGKRHRLKTDFANMAVTIPVTIIVST